MQRVFNQWFEVKIDELFTELKSVRAEMLKRGIKVQSENVTDNATEYLIIERGTTFKRQYFNVALRNWCEEEVKRLLGLEYRQPSDRK
ncbi:MAG TPA: hypothetical protein VNS08_13500 [Ureibacillus sp.]|nr:hypothetical protein [Ureibacillus sp.]